MINIQNMTFKYKFGELDYSIDFQSYIDNSAILLDVRTLEEFEINQIKGSLHIPLDELEYRLSNTEGILKPQEPILVYCQSGIRSQFAKEILLRYGFEEVYNAGSWMNFEENEK